MSVDLYSILKHGNDYYKNPENLKKYALENGYKLDSDLSDNNHQILYNQKHNKLIHHISGTNNNISTGKTLYDWGNNALILTNHTRSSPRYQIEKDIHKKALEKYKPSSDNIVGFSQGGAHTTELTKEFKNSIGHAYNRATPILGQINDSKNLNKYKVQLDPASVRDMFSLKRQQTFHTSPFNGILEQHSVDNLKNSNIQIK